MSVDTLLIHFPKDLLKQIKLPPTFKKEVRLSLSFPGKKQLNLILVLPPSYLVMCLGRNSREVQFQPASGKNADPTASGSHELHLGTCCCIQTAHLNCGDKAPGHVAEPWVAASALFQI